VPVNAPDHAQPAIPPPSRSSFVLGAAFIALLATLLVAYSGKSRNRAGPTDDPALCEAARVWRAKYPPSEELQVIATTVTFLGRPGNFVSGEGVIVAPVAVALPGAQEIMEVGGSPAPLRVLKMDAISELAWEYAGTLMRDIHVLGFALVKRPTPKPFVLPPHPTFDTLPHELKVDATLTTAALEEHHTARCKGFVPWVRATAGDPPYTEQLLRVVLKLGEHIRRGKEDKNSTRVEDLCAAIRENVFTEHQAQVAAVMAARELGAPAFGLLAADPWHRYVVATYVDGAGWITLDVGASKSGYSAGGPALVSMAPTVGQSQANQDSGWNPAGAAYSKQGFGFVFPFTRTEWQDASKGDVTTTTSSPLAEVCR
jgi:hypothetical protein